MSSSTAPQGTGTLSYEQAGVNYDLIDPLKVSAQRAAAATARHLTTHGFAEVAASRGESAYVVDVGPFYIASIVECLGSKALVADEMAALTGRSWYDGIAQDTIAMAVNDLITVGATPLVVQAYWAAGGSDWFGDAARAQARLVSTAAHRRARRQLDLPQKDPRLGIDDRQRVSVGVYHRQHLGAGVELQALRLARLTFRVAHGRGRIRVRAAGAERRGEPPQRRGPPKRPHWLTPPQRPETQATAGPHSLAIVPVQHTRSQSVDPTEERTQTVPTAAPPLVCGPAGSP